jgi:hypothetical protein
MARCYANENFPLPVVEELRLLGHDVVTIQETGQSGRALPDEAGLAFAHAESRILLTLNRRHFVRLHLEGAEHSGIVACTYDPDFPGQAQRIHKVLGQASGLAGKLVRENRPPD